jgi:ABC-2 type transport system permease protein
MNRFAWLMRREVWEHRSIWMAPAIVLALLLVGAATGNVVLGKVNVTMDGDAADSAGLTREDVQDLQRIGDAKDTARLEKLKKLEKLERLKQGDSSGMQSMSAAEALAKVPPEKRQGLLVIVYAAVAALMFVVMGIIGFFYALDSLYADRRDRSVLFWKSMPLSDMETVLSKFAICAVAIPLVAAVAAVAGQLVMAVGGSIKLMLTGGDAGLMWIPQALGGGALAVAVLAVICALWYAPVAAYLQLASAWAPRSPFLWAVLPPAAAAMLEKIAFGSSHLVHFLSHRATAPLQALFQDSRDKGEALSGMHLVDNITGLMTSADMVLGIVATIALLAAVVWVRRYRDESL